MLSFYEQSKTKPQAIAPKRDCLSRTETDRQRQRHIERDRDTQRERERETDADTWFIVKATGPYTRMYITLQHYL